MPARVAPGPQATYPSLDRRDAHALEPGCHFRQLRISATRQR
jgi:hypothetical protein